MIRTRIFAAAIVATVALPHALAAQGAAGDSSRSVADGGIHVAGWMGRVDANEAAAGLTLNDARFHEENGAIIVTTGPATTYWNPANVATGNYTVRATFTEPHQYPEGIEHVLVNGQFVVDAGRLTMALPGKVITNRHSARSTRPATER